MSRYVIEYRWRKDKNWIRPAHDVVYTSLEAAIRAMTLLIETFSDWGFTFRIEPKENYGQEDSITGS